MLEAYLNLAEGCTVTVKVTREEEAAMLALNDHGILKLEPYDLGVIEEIIEKIVDKIWK